jgi:hypothetical protein
MMMYQLTFQRGDAEDLIAVARDACDGYDWLFLRRHVSAPSHITQGLPCSIA